VHKQVKKQLLDNLRKYILHFYGPNPQENKDFGRIINVQHTERLAELIDREKIIIGGEYDIANRTSRPRF